MTSLNIFESLRNGRISVGIVRGPVTDPDVIASVPLAEVPVDHVVVPPDHRLARFERVDVSDLEGEPVLLVERDDAPRAHDDITLYFAEIGIRPRWITHGATQIERVFDMVSVGAGIGWLNTWQAERESGRTDVAIRPLRSRRHARRVPHRVARRRHQPGHRDVRPRPPRGLRRLTRNSDLSAPM